MSKNQDRADFVRLLTSLLPVYNCGIEQAVTHADKALSLVKERFPDEPLEATGEEAGDAAPVGDGRPTEATGSTPVSAPVCRWVWWGSHGCYQTSCGMLGSRNAPATCVCGRTVEILMERVYEDETVKSEPTVPAPVEAAVEERPLWRRRARRAEKELLDVRVDVEREKARADALETQHLEDCRLIEAMTASARTALDKISALEAALPHWRAIVRSAVRWFQAEAHSVDEMRAARDFDATIDAARAAGLTWEE